MVLKSRSLTYRKPTNPTPSLHSPLSYTHTQARFIKEVSPRSTITVSGESLQVIDIVSDTVVIVKSGPMDPRVLAALTTPDTPGMAFKITPHVDQSSMFDSVVGAVFINKACLKFVF